MDGKKLVIVAGLAAIAVIGWRVLRTGDDHPARGAHPGAAASGAPEAPTDPGSPAATADDRVHPIRPVIRVPSQGGDPSAPTPDAAPPAHPAMANGFDAESRDSGWADQHEQEIARRLDKIHVDGVTLDRTECKSEMCRITFSAADDHSLAPYWHKLQSPDGLQGYAQMLVVEDITDTDDGRRQERVYARFAE